MMIERDLPPRLRKAAREFPAVTLSGLSQSGKTTLCRKVFPKLEYVSLEAPDIRNFAVDDPRGFLAQFPKGAVIDEVERGPGLPSYLQGIIDEDPKPGRWILTGSHDLSLLESVTQPLAGRTAVSNLLPLSRTEVSRFKRHPKTLDESLLAGGYPRIFDKRFDPSDRLASYVASYLERDLRTITNVGDLSTFQRFVELCAGRSGQLLDYRRSRATAGSRSPRPRPG